ncbi:winged helix-turn-helix transcriptional regulator [Anaerolineae bacterium CFX9]|jgi:DNA-binding transcriptional ArsR family regulator|nr:winged helix-turn-helix transcriptional regulator [Anaerolineae bacterium CFX9]
MMLNQEIVSFAKVIADETRLELMNHLCCVWLSVNDLVEKLGGRVNQPTVSHHLKKLEEANLVFVREQGRHRLYTLNRSRVRMCCGMIAENLDPSALIDVALDDIPVRPNEN